MSAETADETRPGGRGLRRAAVPVGVVGAMAAIGAGLWPALASGGSPELPEVTVEELLTMVAESDTRQLSGTVTVDADLGALGLAGMLDGGAGALADLLSGEATLRVAVDGTDRQRLAVVDGDEEFSLIHNGEELWAYDSASNTVYQATVPAAGSEDGEHEDDLGLTPQEAAESLLDELDGQADLAVDGTARVAGRDAYQLVAEPTGDTASETDLTSVRIAVDAETGVPLAVTAEGEDGDAVDVAFSQITYQQPPGGQFEFTPPEDATVREIDPDDFLGSILSGSLGDLLSQD